MCVCLSVCPRGYLRNHSRDLCQIFVPVAHDRGSVLLRHVNDRPHRLSAGRGDRSAQRERSVIYDCLVQCVMCYRSTRHPGDPSKNRDINPSSHRPIARTVRDACCHSHYYYRKHRLRLVSTQIFYFARGSGAKYCDGRMSVCLSVCLSARTSRKYRVQTSRNFLYTLPVAVARSFSDDNAIRYILPVLWMTSRLSIIGEAMAMLIERMLRLIQQGAAPGGAKS